jgi:hypothetical protein
MNQVEQQPIVTFGFDYSNGRDESIITKCTIKGGACIIVPAKCQEFAEAYVELLHQPENGWGQNVHPTFGISHNMLHIGHVHFGKEAFNEAVDTELARRKPNHAAQ